MVFTVTEFSDTFQCFDVLSISIGDVFPPVDKGSVFDFIEKVFDKSGKTVLIKRAFKGIFDDLLCLLFIHI